MNLPTLVFFILGDASAQQCEKSGYVQGSCADSERDAYACCPSDALRAQWAEAERRRQAERQEAAREEAARQEAVRQAAALLSPLKQKAQHVYPLQAVPAGTYTLGCTPGQGDECGDDEKPSHDVLLPQPFLMGKTEVTQGLYEQIMGNNPSSNSSCGSSCPVEQVSWYDAVAFANALSEHLGLPQCYAISGENVTLPSGLSCGGFRLPTEAEWEIAARGGQDLRYSGSNSADAVGWYNENSGYDTHPVGQKQPNGYGLYDMSGNVWEWVWDWYDSDEYQNRVALSGDNMTIVSQHDGPKTSVRRVLRGGSNLDGTRFLRSTFRVRGEPEGRDRYCGFRLVLPSPSPA
jgi:formylglycine-generating enzyme required for sulfatase activity